MRKAMKDLNMFINKKSLTRAFNILKELIFRKFTIKVKISDL